MNYFGILLIILGVIIALISLYTYMGHDTFLARGYYQKREKEYISYVGKVMGSVSLAIILSGICALFLKENKEWLAIIIFFGSVSIAFFLAAHFCKPKEKKKNAK